MSNYVLSRRRLEPTTQTNIKKLRSSALWDKQMQIRSIIVWRERRDMGSISQKVVKCDFQAFDWLKFTLTTDLRLTTFCEIDPWCLTSLSTIFQIYWWRQLEYPEKATDLSQITDKLTIVWKTLVLPHHFTEMGWGRS